MRDPFKVRSVELLGALLVAVYESPEGALPWLQLVDLCADRWPWKTVENAIYDLVAYGALHKVGKPAGRSSRPEGRVLRGTVLGAAWLRDELGVAAVVGDWPFPASLRR